MKHFTLTNNTKTSITGITLYQIQASIDIKICWIKKGDLGGYVASLDNLHDNAWVSGNAQVYGNAQVSGNAQVYGDARVYGDAQVFGDAIVDSVSAIVVLCVAMQYSVTITRSLIFIGCKIFTRKEIKKITKTKAFKLGIPKHLYQGYKEIVLGAMKLVKEKP